MGTEPANVIFSGRHASSSWRSMVLFWSSLCLVLNQALAISYMRSNQLGYISPVTDISYVESPNGLNIEIRIPSDTHLSNLERRWYVQADPNSARALHEQYSVSSDSSLDSLALYTFLTRNTSQIEVPEGDLQFKLTLATQDDAWSGLENENGELDDTLRVMSGKSYRLVSSLSEGREFSTYKNVGWSRIVVSNDTGLPSFIGTWLVDDELGLGTPRTVYHMTTVENLASVLSEDEKAQLLNSEWDRAQPVIWREFDLTAGTTLAHMEEFSADNFEYLRQIDKDHSSLFRRNSDTSGNSVTGVNLYETIGDTTGCPSRRMVSLVGAVADCNFLKAFNSTQSARSHLLDTVSDASRYFERAFNISLGLKSIIMANSSDCPVNDTEHEWNVGCQFGNGTLSDRLSLISRWRAQTRPNDGIATWTLFTNCPQGGVVGLAWLGLVCQPGGTSVVTNSLINSRVLAHELGHSFGAVHDCDDSTCGAGDDKTSECCPVGENSCAAGGQYIMSPASSNSQNAFSPCSQGNVCSNIGRRSINSTCLLPNSGQISLITENVCGNGIVEEGEECDCGGPEGCQGNSCCDPLTCKLTTGSQCDDTNDQCCTGCKFSSSDTVCHSSSGPCDYTEYCSGNSTGCPNLRVRPDGTSCRLENSTATNLQCISGHCTSRDLQCVTLMGNRTQSRTGSTLNVIRACQDDSSCQLSCIDSRYGSSVCFTTSQNFLDGTPCRGSGRCRGGTCVGGRSTSIFDDDVPGSSWEWWKYVVIAIACVFGGAFVLWFVFSLFRRKHEVQRRYQGPRPPQPFTQSMPNYAPPPPPPMSHYTQNYAPPPPRYGAENYYPPPPQYVPSYEQFEPSSSSSASNFEAPPYPPPQPARQFKP